MRDDLITIKSFSSEIEAEIIANKLKVFGIATFISKDDCGGTDPMMQQVFGVHLKVKTKDSQKAIPLIEKSSSPGRGSEDVSSKSNLPFLILLFLAVGTGLFLSGHAYSPILIKFGVIFLSVGVVLWLYTRFILRTRERT